MCMVWYDVELQRYDDDDIWVLLLVRNQLDHMVCVYMHRCHVTMNPWPPARDVHLQIAWHGSMGIQYGQLKLLWIELYFVIWVVPKWFDWLCTNKWIVNNIKSSKAISIFVLFFLFSKINFLGLRKKKSNFYIFS